MLKQKPLDYATASAGDMARALAQRQVSSAELVAEAVRTIETKDAAINAVAVRDFERAAAAARAADAALARGESRPLLGVPMTVKESNNVAGLPTTWGYEDARDWVPSRDATGVARLKAAGAIIVGKTNVPPSLADWQSANPVYGRTSNPHDLGRSPGGSSGGAAAALAAGMVPLELGSDIGGSIRIPAHFCGVFGHKPSWQIVPPTGHAPPGVEDAGADIQFAVVGPLARTAADLDLALALLAGPEGDASRAFSFALPPARRAALAGSRVLVLESHPAAALDDEVGAPLQALARRLADAGAEVASQSPLLPDLAAAHETYTRLLMTIMSRRPGAPAPGVIDAHAYMAGLDVLAAHRRAWTELFAAFDVVLAPPFGTAAFPHVDEPDWGKRTLAINGAATPYGAQLAWPGIATFPGLPSTCAPIARTSRGLPVGVQIIGPRFEDRTPIAFAGLIEREFGTGA
ncbi:MAG TPA: amidase family protein [Caulobacteraceae bacterium]|nr:amidase family protein [Caulobacteraceae bacterium]